MRQALLIFIFLFASAGSYAQYSFSQSATGNITVSSVLELSVNSAAAITFSDVNDYANGQTVANYATISLKSNILWLVNISANATYFTALSSGASTTMPASVLNIKLNTSGNYMNLSTTAQTLKTGGRGSGQSFSVDLNSNPGYNYPGGLYSIGIIYTLTSQ